MRRFLASLLVLASVTAQATTATGADQLVSGRVAPQVGAAISLDGSVDRGGSTVPVEVTRERRGDVVIVTISPL